MANEYEIKTLDDILKIPSDRQEIMFAELIPRIKQMTEAREMISEILPEGQNIDDVMKLGTMTWMDDGKTEIETTINIKGKPLEEGEE
jgi:hypothetical protein